MQKSVIVDLTYDVLKRQIKELQAQRNISNDDMETILYRVLADIKVEKERDYAETILNLTYQLQEMNKKLEEKDDIKEVPSEKEK